MHDIGYDRSKSVVTVGANAILPSIYVENELTGNSNNLRYRNRVATDEEPTNLTFKVEEGVDRSLGHFSLGSSIRTTPAYGTPGTTLSSSNYDGDYTTPDSGFTGFRKRPELPDRKFHGKNLSFSDDSFDAVSTTKGVDVKEPTPIKSDEQVKIKASLEELQRRWRHHQRRAALFGNKDVFGDMWDSMSDLDAIKEILPLVVTTIIIASCVVAVCLLTSGLGRNPSAVKMPDNMNGKYQSIQFGRSRLTERLKRENRSPPTIIRDENGVPLGGKKASIQFAYNMRNKLNSDGPDAKPKIEAGVEPEAVIGAENAADVEPEADSEPEGDSEEEMLDELSMKVASKVVNLYDQLSKETGGTREEEFQRQELMKKIRNFGHFATTKIAPKELDLDSKTEDDKPDVRAEAEPAVATEPAAVKPATPIPDAKLEVKLESKPSLKVRVKRTPTKDPFRKFRKSDQLSKAAVPLSKPKSSPQPKGNGQKAAAKDEDDPYGGFRNKA